MKARPPPARDVGASGRAPSRVLSDAQHEDWRGQAQQAGIALGASDAAELGILSTGGINGEEHTSKRLEGLLPPGIAPFAAAGAGGSAAPPLLTFEAAAAAAGLLASPRQLTVATGAAAAATEAGLFLNLAPFMDLAPLTVRRDTLGTAVHHLFLAMSLRHLCVVDARNYTCGIITRKDLDHAAGEGWWRCAARHAWALSAMPTRLLADSWLLSLCSAERWGFHKLLGATASWRFWGHLVCCIASASCGQSVRVLVKMHGHPPSLLSAE